MGLFCFFTHLPRRSQQSSLSRYTAAGESRNAIAGTCPKKHEPKEQRPGTLPAKGEALVTTSPSNDRAEGSLHLSRVRSQTRRGIQRLRSPPVSSVVHRLPFTRAFTRRRVIQQRKARAPLQGSQHPHSPSKTLNRRVKRSTLGRPPPPEHLTTS